MSGRLFLGRYILVHDVPVLVDDRTEVARQRPAEQFQLRTDCGYVRVSTVFLGIDHSFGVGLAPILFETMVFPNLDSDYATWFYDLACVRYATKAEAEAGHASMVARAAAGEWRNWRGNL